MTIDPAILAVFGEAPAGLDLDASLVKRYNIANAVIFGLAVGVVVLRLCVRKWRSNLWYDDYAIIVATLCTTSTLVMTVLAGKHGAGEHVWSTSMDRFIGLLKIVYAEPFVYALSVTSVKISVLLLYRRIFNTKAGAMKSFTVMFWFAVFMTSSYPPILWITMACACKPVSYYWNQYLGAEGTCIDVEQFFLALGIVNMINDIVLLIVPIPGIWVLQMNKKMKVSIGGIMMLGGLVCVASIFRIYYLNGLFKNVDATWWMGPSFAWSGIEPMVAIISACLPTLAPLFRMARLKNSSGGFGYSGSASHEPGRIGNSQSGRYVLSSTARNNQGHFRFDDDEVELTCTAGRGEGRSEGNGNNNRTVSKGGSLDEESEENGITVQTQISVVAMTKV